VLAYGLYVVSVVDDENLCGGCGTASTHLLQNTTKNRKKLLESWKRVFQGDHNRQATIKSRCNNLLWVL
jgi:hypothetical protein